MEKTCFVIMGFGIKNGVNLDLVYNKIIKPSIIENKLIPFPLYEESSFNAYRCDEIAGTTSIDYKFVTCLSGADIVIADISTMNVNAIYELGARHALKPHTTILLCQINKKKKFSFFDLTYVPIIFYDNKNNSFTDEMIAEIRGELNNALRFAIIEKNKYVDNPIQRALIERKNYATCQNKELSLYQIYLDGIKALDKNNFKYAYDKFNELYNIDNTEENLLLMSLAQYKLAEKYKNCKDLIDCLQFLEQNADVDNSTSEILFGRIAAISLRLYNITKESYYYNKALDFYRKGSLFSKNNLYCPRNYCALLLKIHELTNNKDLLFEHYYTSKYYAKLFLSKQCAVMNTGTYQEQVYYKYNKKDLEAIVNGAYNNYEHELQNLIDNNQITIRQKDTIRLGMQSFKNDLDIMTKNIKLFLDLKTYNY